MNLLCVHLINLSVTNGFVETLIPVDRKPLTLRLLLSYVFFVLVTGRMSFPNASAYCISKYGIEAFSDALRREMSPWGVLVSMIEPGMFQTGIAHNVVESIKQLWNNLSPEMKKDYEDQRLDGSKCKLLLHAKFNDIKTLNKKNNFILIRSKNYIRVRLRKLC